jgi:hypothetical protein
MGSEYWVHLVLSLSWCVLALSVQRISFCIAEAPLSSERSGTKNLFGSRNIFNYCVLGVIR